MRPGEITILSEEDATALERGDLLPKPLDERLVDIDQRSLEWAKARAGKITASRICDVLASSKDKYALCILDDAGEIVTKLGNGAAAEKKAESARKKGQRVEVALYEKGGKLKAYRDYVTELAVERMTGNPIYIPDSAATRWGREQEPHARAAFARATGHWVDTPGLITHPKYDFMLCSPDGVFDTPAGKTGAEVKCPFNSTNHMDAWLGNKYEEHKPQVQFSMYVADAEPWFLCSYDPRFPDDLKLYKYKAVRDEEYISQIEEACLALNAEVDEKIQQRLQAAKEG